MLDGTRKFGCMVKDCRIFLVQLVRGCASPQPIAKSASLWSNRVFHQQVAREEINVIKCAGGRSDAFLGCAGILKSLPHLADCRCKTPIIRKPAEQRVD